MKSRRERDFIRIVVSFRVHPVSEYGLLRDIPAHEENGDEVFSEGLSGGLRYFKQLRKGGPPGFPLQRSGKNSGGGRHHPSVTV